MKTILCFQEWLGQFSDILFIVAKKCNLLKASIWSKKLTFLERGLRTQSAWCKAVSGFTAPLCRTSHSQTPSNWPWITSHPDQTIQTIVGIRLVTSFSGYPTKLFSNFPRMTFSGSHSLRAEGPKTNSSRPRDKTLKHRGFKLGVRWGGIPNLAQNSILMVLVHLNVHQ